MYVLTLNTLKFQAMSGICFLVIAPLLSFAQEIVPSGWRRPTLSEAGEAWRKKSPTKFLVVKGDFDGDGKQDVAEFLVDTKKQQFALFVKTASSGDWRMLGEPIEMQYFDRFALELVKPGRYETACGKGYDDAFCAHGEPDYLVLSHPAIDFIYTESADSIFYWDEKTKGFREIAMSD